jgi:hypothetical protein
MSVLKPFITSDIVVSPFEVNKIFIFQDGELNNPNVNIDRYIGQNITSSLWVSGSNPTGYINIQDKILVYRSTKELYYSNYISGSNGSPLGTASFNPDGTITGPTYTPNYYNYLSNTLLPNRYFPTGSNELIGVITIPSNLFGEYIKPGTFHLARSGSAPSNNYPDTNYINNYFNSLSSTTIVLYDDGEGNVLCNNQKVGDIIYEHGIIILTRDVIPPVTGYGYVSYGLTAYGFGTPVNINDIINSSDLLISFQSTVTIYETQYKCTIRQNEFNFSQNPTLISGSSNSGILYDFATGSYFDPYATTVGLYNNNQELLAVAKLSQPLPISSVTDTNIIINLDL